MNFASSRPEITRQIADATRAITTLEARLNNPGYTDRAPPAMVEQTRAQLAKAQADLAAAKAALERLG